MGASDGERTGNLLLDALDVGERADLLGGLAQRAIEEGDVWRTPGDPVTSVIFPTSGALSLVAETDGRRVESSTIGREGAADVFSAIGSRIAPQLLISQVTGRAFDIPIDVFLAVFAESARLRTLIHGYVEALFVQTSMSAACLAVHQLNERCARWLLQVHDRVDDDTFDLKQEFLASMLGVHRPSVSIAAGALQASGLISYKRGHITILDREGLEDAACGCYETIRLGYSRLVPLVA